MVPDRAGRSARGAPSRRRPPALTSTQGIARTAVLAAAGAALFVLESFLPAPVPFLRIGLANVSSVLALSLLGPLPMLVVALIRVVAGSALTGTLLGPAFLLALGGALAASGAMAGIRFLAGERVSELGVSLAGAAAHVVAQLALVRFLMTGSDAVYVLLPLLLGTALAGGFVVGTISLGLLRLLRTAGVA